MAAAAAVVVEAWKSAVKREQTSNGDSLARAWSGQPDLRLAPRLITCFLRAALQGWHESVRDGVEPSKHSGSVRSHCLLRQWHRAANAHEL